MYPPDPDVDLVEHGGCEDHDGGLQRGGVPDGLGALELHAGVGERVRAAVADLDPQGGQRDLDEELEDVRQGQVGQETVRRRHPALEQVHAPRHRGDDVAVRDHHALGVARGARRVHDHGDVVRRRHVVGGADGLPLGDELVDGVDVAARRGQLGPEPGVVVRQRHDVPHGSARGDDLDEDLQEPRVHDDHRRLRLLDAVRRALLA
mmetsp:Transcript_103327/g.292760  ORF Transcript_103327/g.292760 Transcript_103327/m.292760 type:complete len:206 (-) Transcript_103327:636-1253(-)